MRRTMICALIAIPFLLALSYPWRNADGGPGAVLSGIGWFGFLLAVLTVLVTSTVLAVRRLRSRRA